MPVTRVAATLLVLLAFGAACGDDGSTTGSEPGLIEQLRGRTFLSREVTGRDLVAGTELRLTFRDDDTLGASAGCNQLSGLVAVDADRLVVTELGTTEMGCDEARHDQDAWFAGLLGSRPTVVVADDASMTLRGGGARAGDVVRFVDREVAEPDLPLVGTRWVVDTILQGDTAVSPPRAVEAHLVFGDDLTVSGSDGCAPLAGTYRLDGGTLRFAVAPAGADAPGCDQPLLRDALAAAMAGDVTWRIDAARLTLTDSAGFGVSATGAGGEAGTPSVDEG